MDFPGFVYIAHLSPRHALCLVIPTAFTFIMQYITIASMLVGAALGAPAPQDNAKTLAPRWQNIRVSDITLRAAMGILSYASIKLEWDGYTTYCVHQPGSKQHCDDKTYNFHMEDRALWQHDKKARFYVSHKIDNREEVAFVDMGRIECHDGPNMVRIPKHSLL